MQNVFEEIGYYFKWAILDAKNYGIPQGRRRLFVVGFKNKLAYEKNIYSDLCSHDDLLSLF